MKTIELERGAITYVWLNRPEVRNAFHPQKIEELTQVFRNLAVDTSVRAVVLAGRGPSFCAGADLGWMKSMVDFSLQDNLRDSEKLFEMFEAMVELPQPLVASVHGHAMGGALGLVAAADIAIVEKQTMMAFSEVKLGLVPAVISPFVLRKIPRSFAQELMVSGRVFSAQEAARVGLAHFIGDEQECQEELERVLRRLLKNGPQAMHETKKLIDAVSNEPWKDSKGQTAKVIAERRVSEEGQEGLRGFLEKRTPAWQRS